MKWDEKDNFLSEKKSTSSQQKHLNYLIQGIRNWGFPSLGEEKYRCEGLRNLGLDQPHGDD